ncbi:MAG TPA: hypothetical protein VLT32_19810 [Candidatus Sulfomarinibacteraceae bacterium]|nr:hypothetical protein [Candidatus Sulfomarinibacteraceae bacterium]
MHQLTTPFRGFAAAGRAASTGGRPARWRTALPPIVLALALVASPATAAPDEEPTPSATGTPLVDAAPTAPSPPGVEPAAVEAADPSELPTPALERRLAGTIAELRSRTEAAQAGSEAADALDREIDEVTHLVHGWTRRALNSWSSAESEEREQQAWKRLVVLESSLDTLVALRRLNGAKLSPGYVDQRTGLGREGRRQLAGELDHVVLKVRLYKAHRLEDMERIPSRLADLVSIGELVWHLLMAIVVVAAAGWLKRRGPDVLERLRQAAFRSFGRLAWKRRTVRLTNAVEALLPWGSFVLGVVALRWALGPLAGQVEVDIALRLALLYGGYRVAIDGAAALLAGIGRHYKLRVDDATFQRLRRSVRTVLRIVVLLLVVALVSSRWLGQGALYSLVERFAWLVILASILGELFRWRASMVEAYLELSPDGPLASTVRDSRDRWFGVFLAPAAFVWLAFHGLATVVRDFALRFDETQKALAYLFRRKVEKQAEREGYADEVYDDVPPEVVEAFDEAAIDRGPLVVAHFPELDTLQNQVSQWCKSGVGGSALVRGERGVGKTTWLNQLRRKDVEIVRVELGRRILDPGALVSVLAERLEVSGDPESVVELADRLEEGPQRIVVLDLAQHLFLARIGGYDAFTAFAELVNRTRHRVFWIAAVAEYAWRHLRAVHPDWAVFRREIALKGWPEERIRELIRTRSKASGVTFNYADVAVDRIEGVTSRARLVESADGYLRLLWDYSDGNPRVALHFFVRSLDPDRGDRLRVRLFRAPDPTLLEAGGEAGLFVLAAIVTHESISADDLAQVTRSSVSQCHIHVDRLVDLGAARIDDGLVRITTTWQRAAIRLLRRRNLLPG